MLCALALLAVTPLIFGISNLDVRGAAVPLEMFVSLSGMLLLTPVFHPEQDGETEDVVSCRLFPAPAVYFIRTVLSVLALALYIMGFMLLMRAAGSEVSLKLFFGTLADGLFLGGLGMAASAVTGLTAVSYMLPLLFYLLNYGAGEKLKCFWLFSMTKGDYGSNTVLFISGLILALLAITIKWARLKYR